MLIISTSFVNGLCTELNAHPLFQLPNGNTTRLPPVILGQIGKDHQKPTVCFYGHLDVQPAKLEDGWSTEPYVLTEKDGKHSGLINNNII